MEGIVNELDEIEEDTLTINQLTEIQACKVITKPQKVKEGQMINSQIQQNQKKA